MSDTVKKRRISGKKLTLIIIASFLTALILAVGIFFGVASCASGKRVIPDLKQGFTVRKAAPTDGSTPADHSGIDNIAYMAYVLDNQDYYHAYANNSTKSTGYEQITQTWKDYKSAKASGFGSSIMVCSDLSYSSLIKSSTQTCFVGNKSAYMRTGNKPAKNSVPSDISWSEEQPLSYSDEAYLGKYGEFSTELTVYVINEDTVESFGDVIDNGDGTFTQKFSLKEDAAVWYRNKMKTNGSLKTLPTFEKIEISFTFDSKWQVLSSYCEEKASIAPSALGGIAMGSTSKTTTTFSYGENDLDGAHYSCFDNYYKNYVGKEPSGPVITKPAPSMLDVLGNAFSEVINPNGNGQKFNLGLTLGATEYEGRACAKVGNLDDILGSLDIRLELAKKDSGKQDLYIEFSNGAVNVYYSDSFALVADIGRVAEEVSAITEWVNNLKNASAEDIAYALSDEAEEGGLDLSSLLAAVSFTYDDTSARIAIDSDDLLGLGIGVKAGINFSRTIAEDGDTYSFVNLNLGSLTYNGTPVDLGVSLLPGESTEVISRDKSETSADLADYIGGISGLLNSETYLVELNLDGSSQLEYINGIVLDASARLKLENGYNKISVEVPLTVSYKNLSVNLEAFYTINLKDGGLGEVYLNLAQINGEDYGLKVYGNISETVEAVKELIALINSDGEDGNSGTEEVRLLSDGETEEVNTVASIINAVLNINYAKVVKELVANKTQISVTLDADEILSAFDFSLGGIELGNLKLTLTNGEKASLSGNLSALGLSFKLSGSDDGLTVPDKNDYYNIIEVVATVRAAYIEAQNIIKGQDTEFTVNATLTVDGVAMTVKGNGEASWSNGNIRFAVSLEMTIADTAKVEPNSNTVTVNFVYDETEGAPIVKFTVNELGLEIYREDIDEVSNLFTDIINAVNGLLGNGAQASYYSEEADEGNAQPSVPAINYTKLLGTALDIISNVTIELQNPSIGEGGVKDIVIAYAGNGKLTLGANGGLSLGIEIANDEGTEILSLNASVVAGDGSKIDTINTAMDGCKFYTADTFVEAVYNYVLDLLDDLTVKNMLGSDTYTVEIIIDGNTSGIEALNGICVNATLYYTETDDEGAKLIEADINLDINGTAVVAKAYYANRTLYISLEKVGETELEDIAFKAELDNIYGAAKTLVDIITSENLANIIGLLSGTQVQAISLDDGENGKTSLTGILNYILTLDVNSVIKFERIMADETVQNTLTITPDGLLKALGVNVKVGTVYVAVNPKTHSIYASVTSGESEWLTLNAVAAAESEHATLDTDKFIDINFVATLLEDLNKTLSSLGTRTEIVDGEEVKKPDLRISLTGSLNADISYSVVEATVPVNDVKLTAGLDENDKFFFSFTAKLTDAKAKLNLGVGIDIPGDLTVITKAMPISVTYSNGYITMGRQDNNGKNIYKVMTVEYLLDNLLDYTPAGKTLGLIPNYTSNSPVRWLLGTSTTVWGLVCENLNLNINSGLTQAEDYYLYEHTVTEEVPEEDVKAAFALSAILNGMGVKLGDYESVYGNSASSAIKQMGVSDNYYAFDLNLSSLLGDTLSTVYAAIVRNDDGGLKGIRAYATINTDGKEVVKLTVNLDGGLITKESETAKHAEDYFKTVTAAYPEIKLDYDDGAKKFGCYSTEDYSYAYSEYNTDYVLNVYDFGEADLNNCPVNTPATVLNEKHANVVLKSGSVIYVLAEETWLDEEHTLKLVYVDENGNDLGLSFVLKADTNIYMMIVGESKVHFYDKDNNPCNVKDSEDNSLVLYAGDTLPAPKELTVLIDGVSYSFAGWYTKGYEKLVTSVQTGVDEYYAKYIFTNVTLGNGVIYTFTEKEDGYQYVVSGFNSTNNDDTLILANEIIDGNVAYKVTEIAAEAFAKKNLQNVVVPCNITTVGEKAFLDNYGIKSVVFLADKVTMAGSVDGKNFPFYGCSVSNGGSTTYLNVYFNAVSPETQWNHFRDGNNYIGVGNAGGSLNSAGNWSYAKYTVNAGHDISEFGYTDGLVTVFVGEDYLNTVKADVIAKLNSDTAADGLIYKYSVTVEERIAEGIHFITVTITEDTSNAWNKIVLDGGIQLELTSDIQTVNGLYFVKPGATVTVKPVSGNEGLTRLTVYGDEDKTNVLYDSEIVEVTASLGFTMQNSVAYVTAIRAKLPITEITFKSAVAVEGFTENGNVYEKTIPANGGDELSYSVAYEGYTFLGWAFENSDNVLEFEATVNNRVYYAVWAVNRAEVDSSSIAIVDCKFTANTVEGAADSIYGWYVYETNADGKAVFENVATPASLTATTTLVYPRVVYSLSYEMVSNLSGVNYYFVNDDASDKKETQKNGTLTDSIKMLEGSELKYSWNYTSTGTTDSNKVLKLVYIDENGDEKVVYFRIKHGKYSFTPVSSSSTTSYDITGAFTNASVPDSGQESNSLPVNGNLSLTFTAK